MPDQNCDYCLRETEGLKEIECTPDGGRTWLKPIWACFECRDFLKGVFRLYREK